MRQNFIFFVSSLHSLAAALPARWCIALCCASGLIQPPWIAQLIGVWVGARDRHIWSVSHVQGECPQCQRCTCDVCMCACVSAEGRQLLKAQRRHIEKGSGRQRRGSDCCWVLVSQASLQQATDSFLFANNPSLRSIKSRCARK